METRQFKVWRQAANRTMKRRYSIDLADAGVGDDELAMHFRDGETAEDFVEWFGRKYDLYDFNDVLTRPSRALQGR